MLDIAKNGRVLVFSFACVTSGTPRTWIATSENPGVNLLTELSEAGALRVADAIARTRSSGDLIIVSVHWGPNWGYGIPDEQRRFAHALVDRADVSIIHGHSSHHPKAIEVYRDRLILYGCGDFLNDYEGIEGYEQYRDDLVLMYFADIDPRGDLPLSKSSRSKSVNFQLIRPSKEDICWMQQTLDRESRQFGAGVALSPDGRLSLSWKRAIGSDSGL